MASVFCEPHISAAGAAQASPRPASSTSSSGPIGTLVRVCVWRRLCYVLWANVDPGPGTGARARMELFPPAARPSTPPCAGPSETQSHQQKAQNADTWHQVNRERTLVYSGSWERAACGRAPQLGTNAGATGGPGARAGGGLTSGWDGGSVWVCQGATGGWLSLGAALRAEVPISFSDVV